VSTVNEVEEAAIGLIIIYDKPLSFGLKISLQRHQIGVAKPPHNLHVALKHYPITPPTLPPIQPLHRHNQPRIHHRLVRRPHAAPPQQLRRSTHQHLQRILLHLPAAEHKLPTPVRLLHPPHLHLPLLLHTLLHLTPLHNRRFPRRRLPPSHQRNHGHNKNTHKHSRHNTTHNHQPGLLMTPCFGGSRHNQNTLRLFALAQRRRGGRRGGAEEAGAGATVSVNNLPAEARVSRKGGSVEFRQCGSDGNRTSEVVVGDIEESESGLVERRERAGEVVGVETEGDETVEESEPNRD